MENKKIISVFEDLISTIERNAVDNKITISNVNLWAKSWREEMESKLETGVGTTNNKRLDYDVHG